MPLTHKKMGHVMQTKPVHRTSIDLPDGDASDPLMPLPPELPSFPQLPDRPTISRFVNATHSNVKPKQKLTTACAMFLAGAAIVSQSKTQTQSALSSTEVKGGDVIQPLFEFCFRMKGELQ